LGVDTGTSHLNQVYIIVPLQIRDTGKCVVVAATHLKAKKGPVNEQIRQIEALELRHRAENMADTLIEHGWKDVSILMVGDFNSEPMDTSISSILSQEECNGYKKSWKFQSAYPLHENDSSPENSMFTTWKTRKDGTIRRIIDYIFHASHQKQCVEDGEGLRCTHFLSVPEGEVERGHSSVCSGPLPGFRYPSDHLLK